MLWPLLLVLLGALAPATPAPSDGVCGWNADQLQADTPRSVLAVLARGASPAALRSVAELQSWVNGCDETAAREAVLTLRNALSVRRGDPVLNGLLGIALARGPEVQLEGASGRLLRPAHRITNAEKEASRLLLRGAREQRWPELATELADLALATRRKETLEAAETALQAVLTAHPNGETWAVLADVRLARRDYAGARKAGDEAVRLGAPAGARAAGVALLLSGKTDEGGKRYLEGLDHADPPALARYYEDLTLLFTAEERAQWDSTAVSRRSSWLRQGWEWRASIAAVSVPERLAEHFRRVDYALQHFTRLSYRGARPFAALWLMKDTQLNTLNDQGIIYVRHGPPDALSRYINGHTDAINRLAWFYRRVDGGKAMFEFDKDASHVDYFLMDPFTTDCRIAEVYAKWGQQPQSRGFKPLTFPSPLHPSGDGGGYVIPVWWGMFNPTHIKPLDVRCYGTIVDDTGSFRWASGRQLRERAAHVVLSTETATPPLKEPLTLWLNTYAFRGRGGTEVFAYAAIPAAEIRPDTAAPATSYALRLFASVEDPARRTVTRTDTIIRLGPRARFNAGDVLRTGIVISTTSHANATIRLRASNEADSLQGQIVSTARAIPDFGGAAPSLSDLVLAELAGGSWRRGSVGLMPLVAHAVPAGQAFRVYVEGYNFTAGEPLEIRLVVAPGSGSGILARLRELISKRQAMSLSFNESAAVDSDGVMRVLKQVGGEIEPGTYTLELTITRRNTGETVTARAFLTVVEQ